MPRPVMAVIVASMVVLTPGQLVGQAACRTIEGPRVERLRDNYREIAALRDSIEAILERESALDSVGTIKVATDPEAMETDIGFLDFDPPKRAVYRIRGLLGDHFAGVPPEQRNLRINLEAPVVAIEGDRVESCSPVATNDEPITDLLEEVGKTYEEREDGDVLATPVRARVWVFVEWTGQVTDVRIVDSPGDPWLDAALEDVAREMAFTPAKIDGTPLGGWVTRNFMIRP